MQCKHVHVSSSSIMTCMTEREILHNKGHLTRPDSTHFMIRTGQMQKHNLAGTLGNLGQNSTECQVGRGFCACVMHVMYSNKQPWMHARIALMVLSLR